MALSDYERKMLEQLEAQLKDDDPSLADSLAPTKESTGATQMAFSPKHLVLGLIISVVGLLIVLGGVSIESVIVGVLGFFVVFAGMWYLSCGAKRVPAVAREQRQRSTLSFMEKQMEEWRKRQQQ
ncbi:DUF3040 domain-containing protein [Trueperella sp. LYQ143]|uniref:DUF3040 domain-containing protein n=1 Tax=unclassified Trueperella TaxID=2630174 RepID=UPI003983AC77